MSSTMSSSLCGLGNAIVNEMLADEEYGESEWDVHEHAQRSPDRHPDLPAELTAIGEALADKHCKDHTWTQRRDKMRELRRLLSSRASERPAFVELMQIHVKEQLATALGDYRSAIIHEACLTVRALCKHLSPTPWVDMAAWFLPALFKNTKCGTAVISQASKRVIKDLVLHGPLNTDVLHFLLDPAHVRDPHPLYRLTVYQVLLVVVHEVQVERRLHWERLAAAVVAGVEDAMPEVRRIARLLFWAYHALRPDEADVLLKGLDWHEQERMIGIRPTYTRLRSLSDVDFEANDTSAVRRGSRKSPPASPRRKPATGATRSLSATPLPIASANAHLSPRKTSARSFTPQVHYCSWSRGTYPGDAP
eukprot:TRINITY_DN22848_c0_g1_i1.p1 TRINITY_DN22848_c0_g1~~TRINITY_DN22848_c0_g1_i1.p1  ORF type:complete len:381 (+),score=93.19 TRINITY_DN22848_c0_g1_i1:54-1145(+)